MTVESIPDAVYLKGEQETDNGVDKFMLGCPPGDSTMVLYAIFEGGNNAERDIRWPVNWLFLNHSPIRLDKQLARKDITNGKINLIYRLVFPQNGRADTASKERRQYLFAPSRGCRAPR
jgi:hypothetical protein